MAYLGEGTMIAAAHPASETTGKPLSVHVFDAAFDDHEWSVLVPDIHEMRLVSKPVMDFDGLLAALEELCAAKHARLGLLSVLNHGGRDGFWLAHSWISLNTLIGNRNRFQRLGALFGPGGRFEVQSHEDGLNPALVRGIAQLLPAVQVGGERAGKLPFRIVGPAGFKSDTYKLKVAATVNLSEDGASELLYW